MKLIFCPECHDVFKLTERERRRCACGKSGGMYRKDGINAIIDGAAIPIGIDNSSFLKALKNRPNDNLGSKFDAFVIPKKCKTIERY